MANSIGPGSYATGLNGKKHDTAPMLRFDYITGTDGERENVAKFRPNIVGQVGHLSGHFSLLIALVPTPTGVDAGQRLLLGGRGLGRFLLGFGGGSRGSGGLRRLLLGRLLLGSLFLLGLLFLDLGRVQAVLLGLEHDLGLVLEATALLASLDIVNEGHVLAP
ncbi:MAG: hypothetical protein AB7C95_00900 [Synergistaceae bacterium]